MDIPNDLADLHFFKEMEREILREEEEKKNKHEFSLGDFLK